MVPKGANSGIYLMGNYEVQVLDSFGKKQVDTGDMGAVYGKTAPKVNASMAPGEWQKFVIEFHAPKLTPPARRPPTPRWSSVRSTARSSMRTWKSTARTGGAMGKEAPTGPLMFQGDHGPVAYRNIKITLPRKAKP